MFSCMSSLKTELFGCDMSNIGSDCLAGHFSNISTFAQCEFWVCIRIIEFIGPFSLHPGHVIVLKVHSLCSCVQICFIVSIFVHPIGLYLHSVGVSCNILFMMFSARRLLPMKFSLHNGHLTVLSLSVFLSSFMFS